MNEKVSFRIPASTANLGPGFDALSLALTRYLTVTLEPAEMLEIVATGEDIKAIPTTTDNLIYRVAQSAAVHHRRALPPFRMEIHNEIPLARGMGSSAAAIIAGLTVYELLANDTLDEQELFATAFDFENHPDNLSAALYGGLVAAAAAEDGKVMVSRLTIPVKLSAVLVIPSFELPTGKARAVLPPKYSFQDVVFNIQRAALTIAALTTGNLPMIREAMRDRVHQPYRAKLIPGLDEILSFEMKGLLGAVLSGAGPTVFALAEPGYEGQVGQKLVDIFKKHQVEATSLPIDIDTRGRVIERP
jgi:homoserine kinase